ncbi:MAG TPA: hypothetical protein DCL21_03845 [Alphaproteobacteria bacterium]|nr:hypothetical protein [Alphaproteobacteria bacterium]
MFDRVTKGKLKSSAEVFLTEIFSKKSFLWVVAALLIVRVLQIASGFGYNDVVVLLAGMVFLAILFAGLSRFLIRYLNNAIKGVDYITLIMASLAAYCCIDGIIFHPSYIGQDKVDSVRIIVEDYDNVKDDMLILSKGYSVGYMHPEESKRIISDLEGFLDKVEYRRVKSKKVYESIDAKVLDQDLMSLKKAIQVRIDSLLISLTEGERSLFKSNLLRSSARDTIKVFEGFKDDIRPISASFIKVKFDGYIDYSFFFFLSYFSFCIIYLFVEPYYFELKREKIEANA